MRPLLTGLMAACLLAGCGSEPEQAAQPRPETAAYVTPPQITSVESAPAGALAIGGLAEPNARVRLIEMDGTAHGVTADESGRFTLTLPPAPASDRLISVNVQRAGRTVPADGWLFSPAAAPERAVMLRPGAAASPVGAGRLLAAVDVDSAGGVAFSGVAEPGSAVEVRLDGASLGSAVAGARGRWTLRTDAPVSAGRHGILVVSPGGRMERSLDLSGFRPSGPLEALRQGDVLRVAWALPGGGAQTTFILLDPSA